MLNDLLKEAVAHSAGKPAEGIVDLIHSKKHVNEFTVANKMELTINQTRNILYKLSTSNLVSSTREKDEKKGWYTYFWKIEVLKALKFLRNIVQNRADRVEKQINNRESKNFYTCERCGIELNEEQALMHDFLCNECGNVLSLKDNSKVLRALRKNLTKFKNKLAEIDEEIEKEESRLKKEKEKEQPAKKKSAKKKSTTKKSTTKKGAKKKTTTKKSAKSGYSIKETMDKATTKKTTKKAAKKKSATKKTAKKAAKKSASKTSKKSATKKSTAKKTTKKAATKKAAKKSAKKKSTTKKSAAKKTAKKSTTKKPTSKKAAKKKSTAKKSTSKKTTKKTKK